MLPTPLSCLQKQNKNLVKEPGSNFRIPMHQDKPYWQMQADARENVGVCWVPLDKVTKESGPMRYVRGSHRWRDAEGKEGVMLESN